MAVNKQFIDLKNYYSTEEEKDKLIGKMFDKYYSNKFNSFEEFEKFFWEKIYTTIDDIEAGNGIPMEEIVQEMRKTYGIQSNWF